MSAITAKITGTILEAKTSTFKDDAGIERTYGKIQVLGPDMSGEFHQIHNIKVRKEDFGFIPDVAAMKGKRHTLPIEQNLFKGKVSHYLVGSEMPRPAQRAAS